MKKILITGSNGQLGHALNKYYKSHNDYEIYNTDINNLDITNLEEVEKKISEINPDIVINCAAYTNVSGCEQDIDKAYLINSDGPKNLSIVAKKHDIVLVHISTDYVFNGEKNFPYEEDDLTNPQSMYGKTKLAGEKAVISNMYKYFIVRTSWLYGEGANFVRTMMRFAEENKEVNVVNDQIGSPTNADDLAIAIVALLNTNEYGVYHATGNGTCSWYEFASFIFNTMKSNVTLKSVSTEDYPSQVNRPRYSVLNNNKLYNVTHIRLPEWQVSAKKYVLEEMKKMKDYKVLVTGANGYVGRHVVKKLLDLGCKVIASDFKFDGVDSRAEYCTTELFSGHENIYEEFGKPDAVIHLAWKNGFVHNDDSHVKDLSNHYAFLKNMIDGGLKNITVMGTMHEVGYWEGAIDENTPTNPSSLYGIAKNTLREIMPIISNGKDIAVKWLRAYYIMGDDLKNNSIFSKLVQKAEEGADTFPLNSGKNKYDFINVVDLAEQIAKAAIQTEITGVVNCCTGKPVSLGEKVEEFVKEKGYNIKLEYGVFPDRPYDSPEVWGNPDKINKILENFRNN